MVRPLCDWLWFTPVATNDVTGDTMYSWPQIIPLRVLYFIWGYVCAYCFTWFRGNGANAQEGDTGICQDCYILWFK